MNVSKRVCWCVRVPSYFYSCVRSRGSLSSRSFPRARLRSQTSFEQQNHATSEPSTRYGYACARAVHPPSTPIPYAHRSATPPLSACCEIRYYPLVLLRGLQASVYVSVAAYCPADRHRVCGLSLLLCAAPPVPRFC